MPRFEFWVALVWEGTIFESWVALRVDKIFESWVLPGIDAIFESWAAWCAEIGFGSCGVLRLDDVFESWVVILGEVVFESWVELGLGLSVCDCVDVIGIVAADGTLSLER